MDHPWPNFLLASRLRSGRAGGWALCLATLVISQTGCASLKVGMGMRVRLAKTPVTSIAATLPNGPGIAPGEKSPLVVTVTKPDGTKLQTEGKGGGKVFWADLQITPELVTANQKGILTLRHDPRASEGKLAHVTITVPSHPDVAPAQLDIPIRYNYAFVSDFTGATGRPGSDGSDGLDGLSGSIGSTDPNNPSPGGNGSRGGDGTNGGDGGPGGNAPAVDVRVTIKPGKEPLLQVSVSAPGHQRFYLVDPNGGSLTVKADGGSGGPGGRKGRGGRGGSGGMGSPNGSDGPSGMDGMDGSPGRMGRGGIITMTYDPQTKPYLGLIHLSSKNGPAPLLNEAPVAALW